MVIKFAKTYRKQYDKLPLKIRKQADARIKTFAADPSHTQLRDHALHGRYQGYRSINISGDVRALYVQKGTTIVIFAFIGSHSQLYG